MFANLQLTKDLKTKKNFQELQWLSQAEVQKPGCALEAAQKNVDNITAWAFPGWCQSDPVGMSEVPASAHFKSYPRKSALRGRTAAKGMNIRVRRWGELTEEKAEDGKMKRPRGQHVQWSFMQTLKSPPAAEERNSTVVRDASLNWLPGHFVGRRWAVCGGARNAGFPGPLWPLRVSPKSLQELSWGPGVGDLSGNTLSSGDPFRIHGLWSNAPQRTDWCPPKSTSPRKSDCFTWKWGLWRWNYSRMRPYRTGVVSNSKGRRP